MPKNIISGGSVLVLLLALSACDDSGGGGTKQSSALAPPGDLRASVREDSVNLSWSAVSAASSYKVYRDENLLDSVSATSFNETGLGEGSYLYEVASVNDSGESEELAGIRVGIGVDPLQPYQWHLENTGQSAFASSAGTSGEDINYIDASDLGVTGNGVRVNVIDTGLELQHPDLQANILANGSYDYVDGDNDPTNTYQGDGDHGTSVAGLIAAVGDNGLGVAGVAGDALLQGYNFLVAEQQTTANYILAHGLDSKLADTDIFNKSLGLTNLSYDRRLSDDILDTLSCLTSSGSFDNSSNCNGALRSGLGAIYVKAAGNAFYPENESYYLCDDFDLTCANGNMEPEQTYPYQIVVGALNADGEKSSYSTAGSSLWIAASGGEYGSDYNYLDSELHEYGYSYIPSNSSDSLWQPAMVTLDQVGCSRGYTTERVDFGISGVPPIGVTSFHEDNSLNPNCEYTSTFNGTSSATPVVSGVIALMLETNPNLSWREIKHILAQSARQVDADIAAASVPAVVCINSDCSANSDGYKYVYNYNIISFSARDAWITNSAGYKYHNWYGFGAVDAGAAVSLAQNYNEDLGSWQKVTYNYGIVTNIPDATGTPASLAFSVIDDLSIEAVQLDLKMTHGNLRDLAVVLISPASTRSVLLTPFNVFNNADFDSTLISNAFYAESSAGTWTLKVYDLLEGDGGSLTSAIINIYGH